MKELERWPNNWGLVRVPHVKVGRLVKFDVEMLDKWIKQNTVMPMPPRVG